MDVVALHELGDEFAAAALIEPGIVLAGVEAEGQGGVEGEGRVLADIEARQGVAAFDGAVLDGIKRLERGNDLARGEGLDLELAVVASATRLATCVDRPNSVSRLFG